jgi:hypothetical protein
MKPLPGWEGKKGLFYKQKRQNKESGGYLPDSFFYFFSPLFSTTAFFKLRFQQRDNETKKLSWLTGNPTLINKKAYAELILQRHIQQKQQNPTLIDKTTHLFLLLDFTKERELSMD